jgi:putative FmdB family regulatory protein
MPTYEYRCAKCGRHFDVYQSFSEAPLTKHPECGGKVTKVLSPAGIVLKGSGFYKTDSRKGRGAGKDTQPDKEPAAKAADSNGSDSKGPDSKGPDSKGPDSKGPDSKGSESKASEAGSSNSSRSSAGSSRPEDSSAKGAAKSA